MILYSYLSITRSVGIIEQGCVLLSIEPGKEFINKVIVILHQVYSYSCVCSIKYWTNGGLESTQSEVRNGISNMVPRPRN